MDRERRDSGGKFSQEQEQRPDNIRPIARERRGTDNARTANRTIFRRTLILMCIFGAMMFLPLGWKLWNLQITRHDILQEMAVDQQTSETTVTANRGTIYDTSGNVLAISSTAYDVILSPKAIIEEQERLDKAYQSELKRQANGDEKANPEQYHYNAKDLIVTTLPQLLEGVTEEELRSKCEDTNSQYKKVATKVDSTTEDAVREFISTYSLSRCVYLSPNSKRYYPYATLAAQVVGFTNDSGGAYGIEAELNSDLSGQAGLVVTAKNSKGTDLLNFYQDYYDAEDGSSVKLTIDSTIQAYCESYLTEGIEKYDVRNGGFAIAMDCKSGAILGMASSPTYDLNDYSSVIDAVLQQEVTDGSLTESDALNKMWRNKAINDSYEPGSTFKSIVLASGLEDGAITSADSFYCSGSIQVADYTIRCSNHSGHGTQNLAEAVGHSCNPAFIQIGQKIGPERFYSYLENFGLMDSTGIDLPGEGSSVLWSYDNFGITELATASFGQRFTVTPIQLITAINAVVNGGYLYTPHVVESIVDESGEATYQADTTPVRQVISNQTSAQCADILEGVVTSYTGKNAYMAGYRIGGKTGTSQTLVDDEYIVSFMGFAPADDPQVIVLVAFDSPKVSESGSGFSTTGYNISGGTMAAPIAGQLIADILDYQGFEKEYTSADLSGANMPVPSVIGLDETTAAAALEAESLNYRKVGSGETVTGQIPAYGAAIPSGSQVILYMGEEAPSAQIAVPDLNGMTPDEAKKELERNNLYMTASGSSSYYTSATLVYDQSVAAGTRVDAGTVITVYFSDVTVTDADNGALQNE